MYTSIISLAASAVLGSASPDWQTDYREAKALAAREHKPLVVVLASCSKGSAWNGIATEGSLGVETRKLLKESYICVLVDTETEKGRRLAGDFETTGTAVIISDKSGEHQAYRHTGVQSDKELAEVFRRYAHVEKATTTVDPKRPVNAANEFTPAALQQCLT